MKFFSFSKEEIYPSPEEKIISSKDFPILKEASEILEKAKEDISKYREKVKKDSVTIRKKAKEAGFQEGLEILNQHILKLDETIKNLNEEYEKKIIPIAIKAAKKIVSEELKIYPETIVNIIKGALKPVAGHIKVKILVNKKDLDILEKEKPKIRETLEQVQVFALEERNDIEPGGCIIETEKGIINAQLENQFRALEAAFKAFFKK